MARGVNAGHWPVNNVWSSCQLFYRAVSSSSSVNLVFALFGIFKRQHIILIFFFYFAGYCCACACLRVDIPARASVPVPVSIWFSILTLKWFINCPCLSVVDPIISDWQVDRLGLKWEGAPGCLLIYIGFSLQWFLPNKERLIICL